MTSIQRPITSTLPDRLLPGRLQTELDRLIAYLWQHEEADYLARSEHERSHHVFESVWLLDHWFYGHSVEHSLACLVDLREDPDLFLDEHIVA